MQLPTTNGATPPSNIHKHLRKAAGAKTPSILPEFLENNPSLTLDDINDTSYDGRSALHMAAWTGAISNVSLLLDMGCDINSIATRTHNYGKSPIFFAATRSRADVMHLLLERGANVLIVNNKGQSVYSIACSHFGSDVVELVQRIETEQEDSTKPLNGWVDYKKTHPDGNVYGDLDLRFLGRPLTEDDVVKEGVVNPTTKESRKGNFARNNPHAYNSRKWEESTKKKKKKQPPVAPTLTDDEQMQLEKSWDDIQTALQSADSWGVFSSLLAIVQLMEGKKMQSSWVVESASRLSFLVRLQQTLGAITFEPEREATEEIPIADLNSVVSEAAVFSGSGDRHARLVDRMLKNAVDPTLLDALTTRQNGEYSLTDQEDNQLKKYWHDVEAALESNNSKDAFISLLHVVVFWDAKNCSWLGDSTTKLHSMICSSSAVEDVMKRELLNYCDLNNNRHSSLLEKIITKTVASTDENQTTRHITSEPGKEAPARDRAKKKDYFIPDHYHSLFSSLHDTLTEDTSSPTWSVLMNCHNRDRVDGGKANLSLPNHPTWVDCIEDLQSLQSKLHATISSSNLIENSEIRLDKFISFDSEFRSADGRTELATIQLSILEEGIPLAWIVDLYPNPPDAEYSSMTSDVLRWLFLESDAHLLGFAQKHDLHLISAYIGEDLPLSSPKLWDLQLLAAHKMTGNTGASSLPGLKSCCAYFLGDSSSEWQLSKVEQLSDWSQRPLTESQLRYAGLDAAVLLVLLAELVRS